MNRMFLLACVLVLICGCRSKPIQMRETVSISADVYSQHQSATTGTAVARVEYRMELLR